MFENEKKKKKWKMKKVTLGGRGGYMGKIPIKPFFLPIPTIFPNSGRKFTTKWWALGENS